MTDIKCLFCGELTDFLGHSCNDKVKNPMLWDRVRRKHFNKKIENCKIIKIQGKIQEDIQGGKIKGMKMDEINSFFQTR